MQSRPFLPRLILPFAAMIVLIMAVCAGAIYWTAQQTIRQQQIQNLNQLTNLVRGWLAESGGALTPQQRERITSAAQVLGTRITILDGRSDVLLDTDAAAELMERHDDRPEVIEARRRGIGSSVRHSSTINQKAVYVAELLDMDDPDGVVVRLSYPRRVWASFDGSAWAVLGAAAVLALFVLAMMSLALLRQWIAPVRELASAAEQMAAGNWGVRVDPQGAHEIRFFSGRLNIVAAQAQKQLADLQHQRSDLQSLVDTLPDPIFVSDGQQRITLVNSAAARLLGLGAPQVLGQRLTNVINDTALIELFDAMRTESKDHLPPTTLTKTDARDVAGGEAWLQREIRLLRDGQRHTYQAVAKPTAERGVLLVLRDVSTLAAAVQMKTDFVANASHELRTPIAAIKMAFETLREVSDEDPQQATRCVAVIDGHLKRLEEMVRDLLDLSRVEGPDLEPHLAAVRPGDLFAILRSTVGPLAQRKGVELRFDDHAAPAQFTSDERLLNLILKNLMENSIKFTPAGGIATLTIETAGPDVLLKVADTGIGIAAEHVERVFERFYQVDPARSGSAGRGTGLGLAIVKHAVAALDGTVELKSKVGEGTTITCRLPQETPEKSE